MVGPELAVYLGHSLGVKLVLVRHGPWFVHEDHRAECVDDLFLADKGIRGCVKLGLLKVNIESCSVWWKWQQEKIKGCTVPAGHICKEAKLQVRIKPTALCSAIDKENLIESPLDFTTLYTITVIAMHLVSHGPHACQLTSLSHAVTMTCDYVCDVTIIWPFCDFGHTFCESVTVMWYFPCSTLVII